MLNEKLNRKEEDVMDAVYTLVGGKDRVLVSPSEILALLPPKAGYTEESLEGILRALELDGYFELISSDRKGERMYVIHLHAAGQAYKRAGKQRRRGLYIKIGITVATAVLSFVIGIILKAIFS